MLLAWAVLLAASQSSQSLCSAPSLALCSVRESQYELCKLKVFWFKRRKNLLDSCEMQMKRKMCLALSPCGLHSDKAKALVPYSYSSQSWQFAAAGKQKVHSCPVVVLCLLSWLTLLTCSKHIILPSQNLIAFCRLVLIPSDQTSFRESAILGCLENVRPLQL